MMDNFEWGAGYQRRFGLYHVEFGSQQRTAKLSAGFYANVIAAGELPAWNRDGRRRDYSFPGLPLPAATSSASP